MAQLYKAYLDESGTHPESEFVVVAGFVSNASEWEALSEEWMKALTEWGIPMFHMTDFESRKGDFVSWGDEERKERLNRLLELINRYTFSNISFAVQKQSFDEILSDKAKKLCGDAYGLAAIGCWNTLANRAKDPTVDGWIDYVMESGCKGSGALLGIYGAESKDPQWLNETRISSLDFRDKLLFPPLQAADILAYEGYKHIQRQLGTETRPTRYPLKQLNVPGRQWHYANEDELRNVNNYLTDLWDRRASRAG